MLRGVEQNPIKSRPVDRKGIRIHGSALKPIRTPTQFGAVEAQKVRTLDFACNAQKFQLSAHPAAQGFADVRTRERLSLQDTDVVAKLGQPQCRGRAGWSAANHHNLTAQISHHVFTTFVS